MLPYRDGCQKPAPYFDQIWAKVDAKNRSWSRAIFEGLLEALAVKSLRRRSLFLGD
jgi:hypothetical protein